MPEFYDPFGLDAIDDVFTASEEEVVTAPEESLEGSGGMSKGGKAVLWLFILLIVIPALLILAAFLIAKFYPKSKLGQ